MTYQRPAYEEVTLAYSGNTVSLRPSLRAAATLEGRYGFPALYRALDDFNLTIISEIILTASSSRQDAAAFLLLLSGRPLFPFFRAVQQPLAELVMMFAPAPVQASDTQPATNTKALTWPEVYADLYGYATGWLGWTPTAAWNATPTDIARAVAAHFEKLTAINGGGSDKQSDAAQAERNIAAGFDPEFDRAGLRALKARIAGGA